MTRHVVIVTGPKHIGRCPACGRIDAKAGTLWNCNVCANRWWAGYRWWDIQHALQPCAVNAPTNSIRLAKEAGLGVRDGKA